VVEQNSPNVDRTDEITSPVTSTEPSSQHGEDRRVAREETLELRLAAIVQSSNDAIVSLDLNGIIQTWNPAAERMFGFTEAEVVGKSIAVIVAPELRDAKRDMVERLRNGEHIDHFEAVRVTKAGKRIDVSMTISPLRDPASGLVGFSGIVRDITERKQAERTIRQTEELFRLAMGNVASGVFTVDLDGTVTYVNPAAETMFGWSNHELLGKKMHDVTHYKHPDGTPFPARDCPVLQVLQEGVELREHEDTFIRKDGRFFPVVCSASPLKRENTTVGLVVGFRDDTQRREAERAVRESEERFRLMADTAPVMVWMSAQDTLCDYFNRQWLEFTGRSFEAERGNGWTDGVHPDDFGHCFEIYLQAFDKREPFRMEYRLRRYDGEYRWVLDSGVPRFNADGSLAGYIGSAIDVTDQRLARETLSNLSQKLMQAHEQECAVIASELHDDLAQQATALALRLQTLSSFLPGGMSEHVRFQELRDQAITLAKAIPALSRRLHPAVVGQLGIAAAAAALCKELSDEHNVQIDFSHDRIPPDLPKDVGFCLFRVLQEALNNAIKHSSSKKFQVSLRIGWSEIELTVNDKGIGFDPEDTSKRGLGLTSMTERLKLVEGQLSIDSKPGRGTTIYARVPLSPNMKSVEGVG